MEGSETKRFCSHCRKHVHDLSAMNREEAREVIGTAGELCVRMRRHADGSLITKDSPKMVRARTRAVRVAGAGLAAGGALVLASCVDPKPDQINESGEKEHEHHEVLGELEVPDPAVMGLMCPIDEPVAEDGR